MLPKIADLARFVGASAIFYYHIGIYTGYPLFVYGESAVGFFILLAGVAYACFSSRRPTNLPGYRRYLAGRLAGIFPMYVVINIGVFLASYLYPSASGVPFTFVDFLLSAAGISQYCGHRYMSTVMWFVPFILQAYLLYPLIERALERINAALMIFGCFVVSMLLTALVYHWCDSADAHVICRGWSVVFRLPEVCVGVVLGRYLQQGKGFRSGLAGLVVYAVLSLGLMVFGWTSFIPDTAYILTLPWAALLATALIAAPCVLVVLPAGGEKLDAGLLRLVGAASFPFYLMHGVAIRFVHHKFGANLLPWIVYYVMVWGGAFVLTVLLGRALKMIRQERRPVLPVGG